MTPTKNRLTQTQLEDILAQDGFYVGLATGAALTALLLVPDPKTALHQALKIFTMLEQGLALWQQFLNDTPAGGSDDK